LNGWTFVFLGWFRKDSEYPLPIVENVTHVTSHCEEARIHWDAMSEKGFAAPLLLGIPLGLMLGIGVYTFGYARGSSYMTDDPAACLNCHVMREQYEGWEKSSHRKVAVCNDCHAPAGFIPKYTVKALNGFNHSLAFTTGRFPDRIQITGRNHVVTEESCLKCHEEITMGINGVRHPGQKVNCVSCHRSAGHAH
jgi:cytochrome c nitrite reductase small subunit